MEWFIQRASSAAPTGGGASTRGGGATEERRTAATAAMKSIAHEIAPICDVQEDDSFVPPPLNFSISVDTIHMCITYFKNDKLECFKRSAIA